MSVSTDVYFNSAATGSRPFSDFEWYAVDSRGQVASLTSAGFGAVPLVVFRDEAEYFTAANHFESQPVRCWHTLHTRESGRQLTRDTLSASMSCPHRHINI